MESLSSGKVSRMARSTGFQGHVRRTGRGCGRRISDLREYFPRAASDDLCKRLAGGDQILGTRALLRCSRQHVECPESPREPVESADETHAGSRNKAERSKPFR